MTSRKVAVITGYGPGLGEQLSVRLMARGMRVIGLSRRAVEGHNPDPRFTALACDVSDQPSVVRTFAKIRAEHGAPSLLVHNAAQLLLDDFMAITPHQFESQWRTSAFGAMLCSREVIPDMLTSGNGTLVFTGATASRKAGPKSAAFASAKFALRGLAQALARQYGKQGIHVIHTVIDGVIWGRRAEEVFKMDPAQCLQAAELADSYLHLIEQPPSVWTHEIDLRPNRAEF